MEKTRTAEGRPRRLLFAADSSAASRAALLAVAGLAVGGAIQVIVLHVADRSESEPGRRLVEDIVCGLIALAVDARPEFRQARPAEIGATIAAAASESRADLVALGSRGRSDLGGLLLGTVARQVLERVSCPVLLVRAGRRAAARRRRVLVAVTGDEDPGDLVPATAAIAEPDARVLVLQLLAPADRGRHPALPAQTVDQMVAGLRRCGVRARGRVDAGLAGTGGEVARTAAAYGADLVVIGSRRVPGLVGQRRASAGLQAPGSRADRQSQVSTYDPRIQPLED